MMPRQVFTPIVMIVLFISCYAKATLGEKIDAVQTSQLNTNHAQFKATHQARIQSVKGYSIDVSTTGAGTIRQFIRADGTVFAIAWKGVSNPNMEALLGSFNDRYQLAAQAKPMVRRSRNNVTKAPGLIVRKFGNMRAWRVQIIATDLMPANVSDEDIQ